MRMRASTEGTVRRARGDAGLLGSRSLMQLRQSSQRLACCAAAAELSLAKRAFKEISRLLVPDTKPGLFAVLHQLSNAAADAAPRRASLPDLYLRHTDPEGKI